MARQAELSALLREVGALMDGHFLLSSGRHSPAYVEKFRLLQHPEQTERLCRLIADRFRDDGPELVAGPTTGGVILSYEVARLLGLRGIFAEKAAGGRAFQRGFEVRPGERTLIVDDVLTTGGSIRDVIEAVRRAGGSRCQSSRRSNCASVPAIRISPLSTGRCLIASRRRTAASSNGSRDITCRT